MRAGSLLAKRLFIDYPKAGVKLTALGQTCRPIGKPASSPGKEFCLNYQKTLIHRLDVIDRRHLENVFTGVAEIYIACLLWLRLQTASTETTKPEDIRGNGEELPGLLSREWKNLLIGWNRRIS